MLTFHSLHATNTNGASVYVPGEECNILHALSVVSVTFVLPSVYGFDSVSVVNYQGLDLISKINKQLLFHRVECRYV